MCSLPPPEFVATEEEKKNNNAVSWSPPSKFDASKWHEPLHRVDDGLHLLGRFVARGQRHDPHAGVVRNLDVRPLLQILETVPHGVGRYAFT